MSVTKLIRNKNGRRTPVYRAQVYVAGQRLADRIFDTQAAAHAWHDATRLNYVRGFHADATVEDITFDQCLDKYVAERLAKLEESTRQSRMLRVTHFRQCPLSNLKMSQMNARALDLWMQWALKQKTAAGKRRTSFLAELKCLSAVLNWYRNYTDADYVVPITKRHREMAKFRRAKMRRPDYFARPDEVRAWIGWLKDHRPPIYYRLACFMMLTGCRIGEATGLLWQEINLDQSFARVVRVCSWDFHTKQPRLEERTKTDGSVRLLLLSEALKTLLREMLEDKEPGQTLVFPNRKGELLKYNAVQSAFNAGFKALDLPWRSTHICRHTFATMALMATRDLGGVQAALGHGNQRITEKYAKNVALLNSGTAEKTSAFLQIDVNKKVHT
jgi:site-specific recombinase XerD